MSRDKFALDAGAYVLGALAPEERRAFEDHLRVCTDCSRAVRDFAGLPGMLAQVDPTALVEGGAQGIPPDLLPKLASEVRRTRRRRRVALLAAAAAAIVLLPLTGAGVTALLEPPTVGEPEVAQAPPPGRPMNAVGQEAVQGAVAMDQVAWGTRLHLECSYEEPASPYADGAPTYSLVVRTRDGDTEQVATWQAVPGKTISVDAATSASADEIASVEVRTATDEAILELSS